jgi:hypothetical protein
MLHNAEWNGKVILNEDYKEHREDFFKLYLRIRQKTEENKNLIQ